MGKTNTLTSHHPERHSSHVNKMNTRSYFKSGHCSATSATLKKMANKKRRQLLKQSKEDKF